MKKRFIFDLDRTLLTCNYELVETAVFEPIFKDDTDYIMKNIGKFLDEYEYINQNYEDARLSEFLTERSGLNFTPEVISRWKNAMMFEADTMEEGVIELLEYLKSKEKSLVVLTNWYGASQIPRLKNAKIYDYFDDVFTGEYQLKPHPLAYIRSIGNYNPRECVIIGDTPGKDYKAPQLHGIDAILYDKDNHHSNDYVKVKKLTDIIEKY
ncbi:MAG: HAD family hydrolase [Bacilli bacterium]|nr:HAD family hydrolase [Bacilli bacterium]